LPTVPTTNNDWIDVNFIEFNSLIKLTNIQNIGMILYTEYWLYFILSGMILLVSMIGAIVLCLYHESMIKRQDLFAQVATEYNKTVINKC
jgi:cellulose synthase/poly-beta-1,6-N-acetylglucosamine synthase-like glycosyltransferase